MGEINNPRYTHLQSIIESLRRNNLIEEETPEAQKTRIENENYSRLLKETYWKIIDLLKQYSDIKEEDYHIIALWIIGTYFFKEFEAYPYLFLNAMRGSGKTRSLKLIISLSWNGELLTSVREAVIFRSAGKGTIGIDEFEGVMKKENDGLREMLNASYKQGLKVKRMKRVKTEAGETHVVESFEPYTPIVMANIWGMEEVLLDRCLTIILEKSNNPTYVKKMEDFRNNTLIENIKNNLNMLKKCSLVQLCSYFSEYNIYKQWNNYINDRYNYITTYNTLTTQTTQTTLNSKLLSFFNKIDATEINGRDLELFMPLFIISSMIEDDLLDKILDVAKNKVKAKRVDEMTESKDVQLIDFVSRQDESWIKIKDLTQHFKLFIQDDEQEYHWVNSKWIGRALKRLELIKEKKRMGEGIELILNPLAAKKKLEVFK